MKPVRTNHYTFFTPLSRGLVELLAWCPYESPGYITTRHGALYRRAREGVRLGLLEKDPTPGVKRYRCTQAGTDVVHMYKSLGWLA